MSSGNPDKQVAQDLRPIASTDVRQSSRAAEIARGTTRLLHQHGFRTLPELALTSGRRADLFSVGRSGEIWIVEIKSSVEDFRLDHKWPEYREFCDRLLFSVMPDFPAGILPVETGLIISDRYGGELVRPAPEHRLAAARRKALTLRFAQVAAGRLMEIAEPKRFLEARSRE